MTARDDEAERDQAEQRHALLDEAECALPQQQPDDERDRNRPPLKADPGRKFERERDAADLGREHQEVDEQRRDERQQEEVEAEPLAHGIGDRVPAHRREAARHLDQEDDADRAEHDRPEELKPEGGPACAAVAIEPISRNPPTLVTMPSEISRSFFIAASAGCGRQGRQSSSPPSRPRRARARRRRDRRPRPPPRRARAPPRPGASG